MTKLSSKWSTCLVCVELSCFSTESLLLKVSWCACMIEKVEENYEKGKTKEINERNMLLFFSFGFLLKEKNERENWWEKWKKIYTQKLKVKVKKKKKSGYVSDFKFNWC